ncbi:MAG TPA: transcriptional regulator [Gemmatimonadales bacterium]|nr:transcriptional regulator [Gemmatimonadales bacterium]
MPRSHEVVRQWQILRSLASSRLGLAAQALADQHGVTSRTIRRDLSALGRAGFPLFQEQGHHCLLWKLDACALKGLDTGFSLMELCALYFSRATLECLSWFPFHDELSRAFERFEHSLKPSMREFLDRIPLAVGAKQPPGGKRVSPCHRERVEQLLEATLQRRMVRMRYHSRSSGRVKEYDLAPQRIVSAEGGLYLRAYVPEYGEMRTFAVERIECLALRDERYTDHTSADAFADSLGAFSGKPERVQISVDPQLACYVAEREWHPTQRLHHLKGGGVLLEMDVTIDAMLRRWIMGLGSQARVLAPARLAEEIRTELRAAHERYAERPAGARAPLFDVPRQQLLPFGELHVLTLVGERVA